MGTFIFITFIVLGGATSRAQAFAFNKVGTFFRQRSHWTQPLRPVPRAGFMTVNRNRMRGTTAPVRGHHLPIRINKLNPTKRSLSRATRIHPTPPQEHRPVHVEEFHPVHTEPSKPRSNEVGCCAHMHAMNSCLLSIACGIDPKQYNGGIVCLYIIRYQ